MGALGSSGGLGELLASSVRVERWLVFALCSCLGARGVRASMDTSIEQC